MNEDRFSAQSYPKHVWNDFVDFKIELNDNGDERISLSVFTKAETKRDVKCSLFLPEFEPSRVMLAGCGSATYIKSLKVEHTKRAPAKDIFAE